MNIITIHDAVRQFIVDEFIYNPEYSAKLKDSTPLLDKNILDSLGVHALIVFLEEHFGIIVLDEDVTRDNFETIDSIVHYVQRKMQCVE